MSERNQIPEWSGGKLENGEFLNYSKDVSRIALVSRFKTVASQGGKHHEEPEPVPPNNV